MVSEVLVRYSLAPWKMIKHNPCKIRGRASWYLYVKLREQQGIEIFEETDSSRNSNWERKNESEEMLDGLKESCWSPFERWCILVFILFTLHTTVAVKVFE